MILPSDFEDIRNCFKNLQSFPLDKSILCFLIKPVLSPSEFEEDIFFYLDSI